ncbi:MAG: hypothetical protein U1C18_00765, partial [Patescibacteria group bacterium]|nr:hypothetical protein [Patescibacteria group bacterium]
FGAENPPEGYGIYIDDMHAAGVAAPGGWANGASGDLAQYEPGIDAVAAAETAVAGEEAAPESEASLLDRAVDFIKSIGQDNEAGAEQFLPGLSVKNVTSHSVALSWNPVQEAEEIRIILGPEPPDASGEMPASVTLATLPGSAAEYTAEGLAANVSAFIRVEAAISGGRTIAGTIAATTIGGPRAPLATPLRQVHAYAPDILMLVLENKGTVYKNGTTANNQGSEWQHGTWRVVRGDKSEIKVTEVWRDSIPVSQPDYGVGFGAPHNDNVVDIDHRIFLKLSEPIGNRDMLSISGPAGLSFLLPFSDLYLETPVIQLNQVSYNPRATSRWAYVSGWMGDGGSLSLSNFPETADILEESKSDMGSRRTVVAGIPLAGRANSDADAGTQVGEIDLSGVPESNNAVYRVRIPGVGVSWQTRVSEEASNRAYITIIRGLFHNRWGGDLSPEYTEHSRPADHAIVYHSDKQNAREFFASDTEKSIQQTLRGGYHDAGDFDQRPMHTVVPQLLMRAHE